MAAEDIQQFLDLLDASPAVTELSVQSADGNRVTIKRRPTAPEHQATTVYDLSEVDNAPFDSEVVSPESTTQLSINAAMVGLFHETDPRIVAGSVVSVGQTVGYIESMRLMNDVVSEVEGIVDLVVASDNLPVEYGQPLFALSAAT